MEPPVLQSPAFREARAAKRSRSAEASDRRADVGPLCDALARHGRDHAVRPRRLYHRLGRCAHGAALRRHVRPRRLCRLPDFDAPFPGSGRPRHGRLPALGAGAGGGRADGDARRPVPPGLDDADGRTDRHPHQPDRGQHARSQSRSRLVPPQRHHAGAVPASRLHARRLSRLPADLRLPRHESRPARRGPSRFLPPSRRRRRRFGRQAPRLLRRVSGGDGPDRRILSADRRHRVHPARPARRAR